MADVFSKRKRTEVMSRIRGHGNKGTELALAKFFRLNRIGGWRRSQPVFGKPDFIFPKLKLAVFVDGCFWHCCPKHGTRPTSNRLFWRKKLKRNQERDRMVNRTLKQSGWKVLRIWQHELKRKNEARLLLKIKRAIQIIR